MASPDAKLAHIRRLMERAASHQDHIKDQIFHPVDRDDIVKAWKETDDVYVSEDLYEQFLQQVNRLEPSEQQAEVERFDLLRLEQAITPPVDLTRLVTEIQDARTSEEQENLIQSYAAAVQVLPYSEQMEALARFSELPGQGQAIE